MTREETKSCISTIEMLQRLAYNIHGVMDVIDADNCKKIIKALEQETVSKESYDHEYFLRKDFEIKIDKLQRQLKEQTMKEDKIRAELEKQEKWLLQAGCNTYNVDIAFSSIISTLAESEVEE